MAGGVNKVILVGNLGNDPEMRHVPSGAAVCEFRIATNESWNDKNGQRQERTEWHRIVVWGKRAEICSKYLSRGRQVFVEGSLRTRSWEDKDGNKRYTTEIVANDIQFLGGGGPGAGGPGAGGPGGGGGPGRGNDAPPSGAEDFPPAEFGGSGSAGGSAGPDDDIPF